MPSISRCAFRSSAETPAPQHTRLQTRDTMSARARTAAGSRERGRPRAVPGVLCEKHLRVVSMCACSKKDGSALFARAEALRHGPVGLDAGERAEPLPHLRRHVRLAPLCTGLSCLSSPAPSPAASPAPSPAIAGSSPAGSAATLAMTFSMAVCSATAVIAMSSCTATCFCACGHRELHRLPTSPPRWWLWPQIFDAAVHGVDEQTETLSPFSASGRPPNTTCPDTGPWEQKKCCLCTAPLETGILLQSTMTLRSRTNDERGERALHGQKFCPTNTWDEKHCKIIIKLPIVETKKKYTSNGGTLRKPTEETQAMAIL